MMDVVAAWVEPGVEPDEDRIRRLEPLRHAASRVLAQMSLHPQAPFPQSPALIRVGKLQHLAILVPRLIPAVAEVSDFEIIGEDHLGVLF
jgi:hypothetical protein